MALLNNQYIFVENEQVQRSVSISEHSVEKGLSVTDNVRREPIELSISGYVVAVPKKNKTVSASTIIKKIRKWMNNGKYVTYKGRTSLKNALITSFDEERSSDISGGCSFSMEIKEVRIASKAYTGSSKKKKATSTKQVTSKKSSSKRYYTVKKNDTLFTIAKKYYGKGSEFKTIYKANKKKIDKANKGLNVTKYTIHAKQRLLIP